MVMEPGHPPASPIQVNFNLQVQNVITTKNANIDVVNVGNQVVAHPPTGTTSTTTTTTARSCTTRSTRH